jgi:hypothetical protein
VCPRPSDDAAVAPPADEAGLRRVPLPDGAELIVRAVRPSDVHGLVALYRGLSEDDRHRRFFSAFCPPRPFFERLACVADRGGYGLVAVVGRDGGDGASPTAPAPLVGEASYELLPNGDGELGMVVAAGQRGWLGPYLLDALAEAAAARGVPNLEADVLVTNSRMLTLLRSRGYATVGSDDWCSLRLVVGTSGPTPTWPGEAAADDRTGRPRVLVEVPGGRWHAGEEARAAGLEVMACSGPGGVRRPRCPVLEGRPCPLAAADAIVVSNVPDDERWQAVVGAHAELHPGVPVCVEPRPGPPGRSGVVPTAGDGAVVFGPEEAPRGVVALVDRLASAHRRARDDDRDA